LSQEHIYFQDEHAVITNARAIIHGKTFSMVNVTSVAQSTEAPQTTIPMLLILGGILIILVAIFVVLAGDGSSAWCGSVGFIMLVVGWLLKRSAKAKHWMVIGSASGETRALWAYDPAYIAQIVAAVNQAIVERG